MTKLFSKFIQFEAASSILLGLSLVLALVLANWGITASVYLNVLHFEFAGLSIQHWINDALMAIFFYLVGMEIKRELVSGSLSSSRKAMLPLFAAIGGMLVPALIFSIINQEPDASRAWGIPMATDIAFAVGALVAIGRKAPIQLRALLLALAVIDDLGAILVIALFYSTGVGPLWLLGFLIVGFINWILNKKGSWNWITHSVLGVIAWAFMLFSGIHATLAGVIWGFLTPDDKTDHAPLDQAIHKLHPFVNFLILPIFALANAGVKLPSVSDGSDLFSSTLLWAIAFGLLLGKPLGIVLSAWICVKSKMGELPTGVTFKHILGLGLLAGIGFTMALFIAQLSLSNEGLLNSAKVGILLGSLFSGLLGVSLLLLFARSKSTLTSKEAT